MSLAEAFAPAEDLYRSQVMHATWGHLAPEERKPYRGWIVFTHGTHGDLTIVDWYLKRGKTELPGSPWLFQQLNEFTANECMKRQSQGVIYRWEGTYLMFKNGGCRFSGKTRRVWKGYRKGLFR
jgi:hypothetical protein